MTGRAPETLLDQLHGLLAGALLEELEREIERAREGDPMNPQFLDKVMKFLAQNGVDAPKASTRVDTLAQKLADLDLDGEVIRMPRQ